MKQTERDLRGLVCAGVVALVLLGLTLFLDGCAKPDYAMIQQMHTATMQSNTAIAAALANGDHKMVNVRFVVEEEMLLPAGTRIEIDANYDWSRSVQFNDPAVNPAVEIFRAEAQRDASVVGNVVDGFKTLGLGIVAGEVIKTMTRHSGDITINADDESTVGFSGLNDTSAGYVGGNFSEGVQMDMSSRPTTTTTTTSGVGQ